MLVIVVLAVVLVLVAVALHRMRRDDGAQRRLERNEYEPLVKHIWHQ